MCHRKIMFSRGKLSKCKALGQVAGSPLEILGRERLHMRKGCPFSQARCQHGEKENIASPIGLVTGLLEQESPDNHQCPNPARSLTTILVNTIVLFVAWWQAFL